MEVREFYSRIEYRDDLSFSYLSQAETNELTHSYHGYPAKFIPQLARIFINEYTEPGDILWDPFCGSGTLNIEAFRNYRHSIGTDINPIAILISRVKTTPLEPEILKEYNEELLSSIQTQIVQNELFYRYQGILNGNTSILKKWFSNESLCELGHILWKIEEKIDDTQYRNFALCAFSAILKKSSYWLNSSVKSCYDPLKNPKNPFHYFEREIKRMEKINLMFYQYEKDNQTKIYLYKGNAKHRPPYYHKKINCVITSPPYVVSYDYSDIFKLSTYFLCYQSNYEKFRKSFIGTPLHSKIKSDIKLNSPHNKIVDEIKNPSMKRLLIKYYDEMNIFFKNVKNSTYKKTHLIMIVGDTESKGIKIHNSYNLSKIAFKNKWDLEKVYERKISNKNLPSSRDPNSGKFTTNKNNSHTEIYKREYVLVFKRG